MVIDCSAIWIGEAGSLHVLKQTAWCAFACCVVGQLAGQKGVCVCGDGGGGKLGTMLFWILSDKMHGKNNYSFS